MIEHPSLKPESIPPCAQPSAVSSAKAWVDTGEVSATSDYRRWWEIAQASVIDCPAALLGYT
jgi:hypothetical protein